MATDPQRTRRQEALQLSADLLDDIELNRIPASDIARKAYRLARLLDDSDAMTWLAFEVSGYPTPLDGPSTRAALRSNRRSGDNRYFTSMPGQLQADVEGAMAQIAAAVDADVSITSANPNQYVAAPTGNTTERSAVRNFAGQQQAVLDKVVGAIHGYVVERNQELRFGAAAATAFEVVRDAVDAAIATLVPEAPTKLAAAFENAVSDNPEHWSNAAQVCRRVLKAASDALRPPGEPVDGRAMTDDKYINRLVDWIVNTEHSKTNADFITSELEYLGRRLDAVDGAGHMGAHAEVDRFTASRFLTGTYLLLGDILRLASPAAPDVG